MALSMAKLVLRAIKGSTLTTSEMDQNLTTIREFGNALAAIISASLNTDGSLKSAVVPTSSLQDRSITQAKLLAQSQFVALSTGAANTYQITFTPAIAAYANGQIYFIASHQANTGAATLKVDALAATAIKKLNGQALAGGELIANSVFAAVYFDFGTGGAFYLLSGTPTQPQNVADIIGASGAIPNGSMEVDSDLDGKPDQWTFTAFGTGTGTLVSAAGDSNAGLKAFKFTCAGGGGANGGGKLESLNFLEVTPNRLFVLSWQMKSTVAGATNKVEVDFYTEAQVFISTSTLYSGNASQPSGWTLFSGGAVVPSNARYAKIRLVGADAASPAANVSFDDVRIGEPVFRKRRDFTVPATYKFTAPTGCYCVKVSCYGAGGGGGGGNGGTPIGGGGGGAGSFSQSWVNVVPGTDYPVVVGAAGTGGASTVNGNSGASSTFNGATVTANGGGGGGGSASGSPAGVGGAAGTGQLASAGESGVTPVLGVGGRGGHADIGAGGVATAGVGGDATVGGGGAGGTNSTAGGKGGDGRVIIEFSTTA